MKGLIDSNLLIYSSTDKAGEYAAARQFVSQVLHGPEIFGITWINVAEYLAVTTQAVGRFPPLLPMSEALNNVNEFLQSPFVSLLAEGKSHMDFLVKILRETGGAKGQFVHDCRIAAIMMENGVDTIFTRDSEFRRIPGIKVIDPLVGS